MTTKKEIYLQDSFEKIESEIEFIEVKPFSKNIIELRLRAVAHKYGNEEANKLIQETGLNTLGWKEVFAK